MGRRKFTLEDDVNAFLERWDSTRHLSFLGDIQALVELYDVDEGDDWVEKVVGAEGLRNVRLMRTVYLVSRIAEFHAPILCSLRGYFPNMWKKMQNHVEKMKLEEMNGQEDQAVAKRDEAIAKG